MSEERSIYNVGNVKPDNLNAFRNRHCTLPFNHPDYKPPEPYEVATLTELAGWSQVRTAKLVGVKSDPKKGSTTVRKWKTEAGDERRQIPYAAWRLMLLYAGVVSLRDGLTVGYNVGPVKLTSLDAFKARASALPFGHPDYRPPEPYEVTALTELAGWSQVRTAKLVGVKSDPKKGSTTVRKWKTEKGDERRQIPYAAWRLMLLYAGVVTLDDEYLHHVSRVADRV